MTRHPQTRDAVEACEALPIPVVQPSTGTLELFDIEQFLLERKMAKGGGGKGGQGTSGAGKGGGAGAGKGSGGKPSTTGNPSGKGRDNNPPRK
ncbi:hypothetical protein GCM10009416_10830 [Craurococcus roseus]|uniref:Uncharacterized protein n=1 Tax=Craurococcus roseus TaxID=77585 RepID=A0ABN1ET76_9PROT